MDAKSRKRGVIASRAKLHAAMLNAGIKTQAALADKIADRESLESPPRDTVNRAFRQQRVSPASIARIARALGVEAYTLYLSAEEQASQADSLNSSASGGSSKSETEQENLETNPKQSLDPNQIDPKQKAANVVGHGALNEKPGQASQQPNANAQHPLGESPNSESHNRLGMRPKNIIGLALLVLASLIIALVLLAQQFMLSKEKLAGDDSAKIASSGKADTKLSPFDHESSELIEADSKNNHQSVSSDSQRHSTKNNVFKLPSQSSLLLFSKQTITDPLVLSISENLAKQFNIAVAERSLVSDQIISSELSQQFQSDGVFTVHTENHGRFVLLQGYLFYQNNEQLIWSASLSKVELKYQLNDVVNQATQAFYRATGRDFDTALLSGTTTALSAHRKYLTARLLLDEFNSELNVKKAQAILLTTIDQFPNFANTRAALCEAYLRESWRENEKDSLDAATKQCDAGKALSTHNYYLTAVLSYIYRRTGKVEQAIELLKQTLSVAPKNVDAISALALAYRDALRQQLANFPNAQANMLSHAKKATELEPDFWLHHNYLGVLSYTAGKTELIASAFESAALLNPNELAYANVATINLCQGNLDKAIKYYRESISLAPDSYIGHETIGTAYLFTKDYQKAIDSKEKALSLMNDSDFVGIYQMWGDLGDAYRLNGNRASAIHAYKKALTIIHREQLRGNFSKADKVYNSYYILRLKQLDPNNFHESAIGFEYRDLEALMTAEMEASAKAKLAFAFYLLKDTQQARKAIKRATDVCVVYHQHPDLLEFDAAIKTAKND